MILDHASDFTSVVMTTFISRTIFVFGTFDFQAADFVVLRIAKESVFATASRLAVDDFANGVATAQDGPVTRIAAFSLAVV